MPVNPTFPGVYIEEIPSGVRTITGVATSITAFIGRTSRGPTDQAVTINSFADFERMFGGLSLDSTLSQAVSDFYLNGGSQAVIARLQNGGAVATLDLATVGAPPNDVLHLLAANEGKWGNNLRAVVNHDTRDANDQNLFNLIISEIDPVTKQVLRTETFLNLSVKDTDVGYVGRKLKQESQLARVLKKTTITDPNDLWQVPNVRPSVTPDPAPAFTNGADGGSLTATDFIGPFTTPGKHGFNLLDDVDLFNILCIPPYLDTGDVDSNVVAAAATYCEGRRAMLLVDPPSTWHSPADAIAGLGAVGTNSKNAAIYFPRLRKANPLLNNQIQEFVPCGAVAGIFARTDTQRGVWKAPAGLDATLVGVAQLSVLLTDLENGQLNPLADLLADDYKYIPVRRLALFIEESLYRGTQWVVFEPNDEPLWAQIRLNVGAFMQNLFRQGAFQGQSPRDAYFVKCDKETTTQNDINLGIVNIVVGFAPLKPAEFVIIKIQQIAGQIQV